MRFPIIAVVQGNAVLWFKGIIGGVNVKKQQISVDLKHYKADHYYGCHGY